MPSKTNPELTFGVEKHGRRLDHFIWSCTRAYPVKHAFSLGDGKPLPNELTTAEAKVMLKKVADFGADNLFISGAGWTGEPLMRKDFLELIRYVAELELAPYVKVTGWHFNRKVAEELAEAKCKAIVCFAGLKETDAKLRGEDAFDESLAAAKLCKEFGIPFAVSVINTKYVANQVSALVEFAIDLGARSFHLASLIPQPIDVENQLKVLGPLESTPQEKETQLEEIYELNKKVRDRILIVPYEMFNNRLLKTKEPQRELRSTCSMCDNLVKNEWLEILEDGKAYACAPLGLEFGDIRTDSIQQIMDRMRVSDKIKTLADRSNLKGKCGICQFKTICGGCRARAYIYSKDPLNQDPACVYQPKKATFEGN
ncbi:MAG: SPASM domain-containing protein [Candidatus Bathyarchaeia archaeon]